MPYTETLAENYLQAKDDARRHAANGEDPLFTAIAGDSKEFVGGIPKETWDAMSPAERERQSTVPPSLQKAGRAAGSGIGALAGGLVGTAAGEAVGGPPGAMWGGYVGAGAGGSLGYDIADDIVKDTSPPKTISRQQLRDQFEHAKEVD